MSDTLDVKALMRTEVVLALKFAPEITDEVLEHLATVPDCEDDETYIIVASEVVRAAAEKALRPTIERLTAEAAAHAARAEEVEAQFEKFQRAFEQFRRMKTSPTRH